MGRSLILKKSAKGNIQAGLALAAKTGDDNFKDYWYNVGPNGTKKNWCNASISQYN
jgi:hypothetical protein